MASNRNSFLPSTRREFLGTSAKGIGLLAFSRFAPEFLVNSTLAAAPALVGLDGFVDTILHVVKQRESATKFLRTTAMREFATKIDGAAGLSANFEFVTQMVTDDLNWTSR